jgi:hypothetical protein
MMTMFEGSNSPSPIAFLLDQMFDIREWLTPVNAQLHNISNPHVFLIQKNTANIVVLMYKNWSRDLEWKPHNDPANGIPILTPVCRLRNNVTHSYYGSALTKKQSFCLHCLICQTMQEHSLSYMEPRFCNSHTVSRATGHLRKQGPIVTGLTAEYFPEECTVDSTIVCIFVLFYPILQYTV